MTISTVCVYIKFPIGTVIGLTLFVAGFMIGIGPLFHVMAPEILTKQGVSLVIFLNWVVVFVIGMGTPALISSVIGPGGTFIIMVIINTLTFFFVLILVKDTTGMERKECQKIYGPK